MRPCLLSDGAEERSGHRVTLLGLRTSPLIAFPGQRPRTAYSGGVDFGCDEEAGATAAAAAVGPHSVNIFASRRRYVGWQPEEAGQGSRLRLGSPLCSPVTTAAAAHRPYPSTMATAPAPAPAPRRFHLQGFVDFFISTAAAATERLTEGDKVRTRTIETSVDPADPSKTIITTTSHIVSSGSKNKGEEEEEEHKPRGPRATADTRVENDINDDEEEMTWLCSTCHRMVRRFKEKRQEWRERREIRRQTRREWFRLRDREKESPIPSTLDEAPPTAEAETAPALLPPPTPTPSAQEKPLAPQKDRAHHKPGAEEKGVAKADGGAAVRQRWKLKDSAMAESMDMKSGFVYSNDIDPNYSMFK